MKRAFKISGKFILSLVVLTIICTVSWQKVVNERLYDCTDAVEFDYWQPGNWVHKDVAVVDHIIHGRSMSELDTIKVGWNVKRLWRLWYSFVGVSIAVSLLLAFVPWTLKRRKLLSSENESSKFFPSRA